MVRLIDLWYLWGTILIFTLVMWLLLPGCVASPWITVNKNVYVLSNEDQVELEYKTESDLDSAVEATQDIKDALKLTPPVSLRGLFDWPPNSPPSPEDQQ